jgi:hypothetical protein
LWGSFTYFLWWCKQEFATHHLWDKGRNNMMVKKVRYLLLLIIAREFSLIYWFEISSFSFFCMHFRGPYSFLSWLEFLQTRYGREVRSAPPIPVVTKLTVNIVETCFLTLSALREGGTDIYARTDGR